MGLAGELKTIGLAEVFQNLAFNSLTGTLLLKEGERKAQVCLEDGRIRAVKSAELDLDYCEIARRAGAAPDDVLDKAASTGRRRTLKAFLRATGSFDEAAFDAAVASEVEESILPLFGWAGSFTFEEGEVKARVFGKELLECNVSLDPQGVAMEAARRSDEWETVKRYVPDPKEILLWTGVWPEEGVEPQIHELVSLFDGVRDLAAVVKASKLRKYEVFKSVGQLVESGIMAVAQPEWLRDLAAQAKAAGDINMAISRLEIALGLDAGDMESRRELVKLYERAGRPEASAKAQLELAEAQAERGDMESALESFERAAVMSPKDLDILERIFELRESVGEPTQWVKAGRRLAEALTRQELFEDALPLYERLLQSGEQSVALQESLAECLFQSGDVAKAADRLLRLADRSRKRGDFETTLAYCRRILEADPKCTAAKERIAAIESGRARRKHRWKRVRLLVILGSTLIGLLAWQGLREWSAQSTLHRAASEISVSLARNNTDRTRVDAMLLYAEVKRQHPYTRAAGQAKETLSALLDAELALINASIEVGAKASTTAEVEFSFGRARKLLHMLQEVPFPDQLAANWETERERLSKRIAAQLDR
ncbi:MAG: DUF4388 domain-containing protein [Planctomycetota bacterium]|jgi:tetratricopeptide (TPR) repeat protein